MKSLNNNILDVELLLFDLDNTLYRSESGIWECIDERIQIYVAQALDLPIEQARVVQKRYWLDYGATIAGLMAEHDVDPAPYMAYVHDLDARRYLQPNGELADVLAALPQRKAIFTNATAEHARNILSALGLLLYFDVLIGMDEVDFVPKPQPESYQRCLQLLNVDAERCMFIEDSPKNLAPARAMGMWTALVGPRSDGLADYYLDRIEDIGILFGLS
ncbi:MAG: pyrimidine 5'-nucleotidase [Chloroflexi bacterium]|nr:pyrimidine 5'-nucleotidase [Chloroflexota bacterium]